MTSTVDDGRLAGLRRRLYGLSFVDEFGPVYAVYTLWFIDNGITAAQLSTVFLVWSVVALTLEIPSGALADLVDRRRLLAAAFTIRAFGIGLWLVWPTVPGVMIGAALWAVHDSLASGAWEAMIHDQLSAVGAADRYGPMMARIGQFSHLGVAAGTVVGAALLRFDVDLVVLGWLTVAAHVGSVSLVATLPSVDSTDPPDDEAARGVASGLATADGATSGDRASGRPAMAGVRSGDGDGDGRGTGTGATSGPGSHADDAAAEHGAGWWATLTSGLGQARTEPLILRLVIVGALLEGLWLIDEYLPLVSRAQGGADATAPVLILIVWLGLLAGGEVAARRSDLRGPVLGGALVIGTGIMALALVADRVWALALVAIGYATMEATQVITDARLQERTAGEVRATVTSVRGFGSAATSMIAFVVIGALAAGDDPRPGLYVLLTALVVVALLVARWVPRRQWGAPPLSSIEPRARVDHMKGSEATGVAIRRHGAAIVAVIAASMTVIGMWGPWFASGSADRNSFGLFRAAQVLGIEWVTPFRIAWFLLPIVLAAALALAAFGARRAAMAVLALLGLVLGVAGWLSVAAFDLRLGSATTAVAGCGTVLAAVLSLAGNAMRGRAGAGVRARATIGAEAGTPSSAESRSGEPPMLSREN